MTGRAAVIAHHGGLLFGRTFQAVCAMCGYRGPHVITRHRAAAIADEHTRRTAGLDVTQ